MGFYYLKFFFSSRAEGPFCLEIDNICVYKDDENKEDIAYETYKLPIKYIANT